MPRNTAASKIGSGMVSFRCCDNSDVIVTLILTKFRLHLIQLGNFGKSLFMATKVIEPP